MARNSRPKRPTSKTAKQVKKIGKHRQVISRFRGQRSREKEEVSRVYSPRWETKLAQHAVAYAPYATTGPVSGESRAIYSLEYDPKRLMMWITFWRYKQKGKGRRYVFYKVSQNVWVALNEASSKGRYFNNFIKGKYNYTRL